LLLDYEYEEKKKSLSLTAKSLAFKFLADIEIYGGATVLSLCALRHDCNKGVVFYPKFPQSNSNSDRFSLYDFVVL